MKKEFFVLIALAAVCLFTACPNAASDNTIIPSGDTVVDILNLTDLITSPVHGKNPDTAFTGNAQYTGSLAWFDAAGTTVFSGPFVAGAGYTAKVTLSPKSGYTFTGFTGNFTYTGVDAADITGAVHAGGDWDVSITFTAETAGVDALDLSEAVSVPVPGSTPQLTIDEDQYMGDIEWQKDNVVFDGPAFEQGETYTAIVTLTAKTGYTFDGFTGGFSHENAVDITDEADEIGGNDWIVTIVFSETEELTVTAVDLTQLVIAPAADEEVERSFTSTQYNGVIVWKESDITFDGLTFAEDDTYTAVVTITPNTGWTFSDFTGTFEHEDADTISQELITSGSEYTVTIVFPTITVERIKVHGEALDLTTGVTAPVAGKAPDATFHHTAHYQYSGSSVNWTKTDNTPAGAVFDYETVYKAEVTLTAEPDHTFDDLAPDSFTCTNATVTFSAISKTVITVTITFPITRVAVIHFENNNYQDFFTVYSNAAAGTVYNNTATDENHTAGGSTSWKVSATAFQEPTGDFNNNNLGLVSKQGAFPVEAGKKYRISLWIKTVDVTAGGWSLGAAPTINANAESGRNVWGPDGISIVGSHDWQEMFCLYTAEVGDTELWIRLALFGAGTVWYDDIKVDEATPLMFANIFTDEHAEALGLTVSTVQISNKGIVDAAITAYNLLEPDVKTLLSSEKTLLNDLKAKIEDLEEVNLSIVSGFKTTHAGALGLTVATVQLGDKGIVDAALTDYNTLDSNIKALLTTEKALLDSLINKISQLEFSSVQLVSWEWKKEYQTTPISAASGGYGGKLLGKDQNGKTVEISLGSANQIISVNSTDGINVPQNSRTLIGLYWDGTRPLTTTTTFLTEGEFNLGQTGTLKVTIGINRIAAGNNSIFLNNSNAANTGGVHDSFNKTTAYPVGTSQTVFEFDLGTIATGSASAYAAALDTTFFQFVQATNNATVDYIKIEVKGPQDWAEDFKADHAEALALTVSTVALTDKGKVDAAISAYNAMGSNVQAYLTAEKALLDSLKIKIDDLQADANQSIADGFKLDHAIALALTVSTVQPGDQEIIEDALAAFGELDAAVKILLAPEKALLDSLLAELGGGPEQFVSWEWRKEWQTTSLSSASLRYAGKLSGREPDGNTVEISLGSLFGAITVNSTDGIKMAGNNQRMLIGHPDWGNVNTPGTTASEYKDGEFNLGTTGTLKITIGRTIATTAATTPTNSVFLNNSSTVVTNSVHATFNVVNIPATPYEMVLEYDLAEIADKGTLATEALGQTFFQLITAPNTISIAVDYIKVEVDRD